MFGPSRKSKAGGAPSTNGQKTGAQRGSAGTFSTIGAALMGLAQPDQPSFDTYRKISGLSTVALVMALVKNPIIVNQWGWRKKPDADDSMLALVKDAMEPLRQKLKTDALRALEFGCAQFEKVWGVSNGADVIVSLPSLSPDITEFICDAKTGVPLGLENKAPNQEPVQLMGSYAWWWTYDEHYGDPRGRSRHENIRREAKYAETIDNKIADYAGKVSGIIGRIHYPQGGTFKDENSADRSAFHIAQQLGNAFTRGQTLLLPNLFANSDDPKLQAELAGKSQWIIDTLDPGGTDYLPGLLELRGYIDKQLVRGWLRPERTCLEASHGTRADAKQHSDNSIEDAVLIDQSLCAAINTGLIDDMLIRNRGEGARGAVWVEPEPISDIEAQTAIQLILAGLANPQIAPALFALADWGAEFDSAGIERIKEAAGDKWRAIADEIMAAEPKPAAPGTAPETEHKPEPQEQPN